MVLRALLARRMGVSTTGECGETFPTRILTPEIYWGISPVKMKFTREFPQQKIRFRPDIDLFKFDVSLFCTQNLATPEK